jgi:integral membrane protein (TIGR01906 family)
MRLVKILISITVPLFLLMLFASLLTTKPYLLVSEGLYESHNDIYYDYDYVVDRIIGYLNYQYDDLEFGSDEFDHYILLSDDAIRHMEDVKTLYTSLRIAAVLSFIVGVSLSMYLYKKDKKEFYFTYRSLPLGVIYVIVFIGAYLLIDFNRAFRIFHNILFSNDLWLLDPDDILIVLLPNNFWIVSGFIVLGLFSIAMAIIYYLNSKIIKKVL